MCFSVNVSFIMTKEHKSAWRTFKDLPKHIGSWLMLHSFGIKLIYPGSIQLLQASISGPLQDGRAQQVLEKGGKRYKIVASDGEILANKAILSVRSRYFRSVFSDNFVESRAGTVKMPYSKAVLDKMIIYLYSGKMACDDMSLQSLLDLMELLNYVNLSEEFSAVEGFAVDNIKAGKFSLSDCLKGLADCSLAGLQAVLEALLAHLGENFENFSQMEDVCLLSQHMVLRLLQEKEDDQSQTIHRYVCFMYLLSLLKSRQISLQIKETCNVKPIFISPGSGLSWLGSLVTLPTLRW